MNNLPPASNSGFVVVTHVHAQGDTQRDTQNVTSPTVASAGPFGSSLGKFLKGEPAILGTVQIMLGIVLLLFGIVLTFDSVAISLFSGIWVWGAIIYITAGSLTIKASKKLSPCVVKASLGMNVVSTVASGIAIILFSLDFLLYSYTYSESAQYGVSAMLLVLSSLEFVVSIYVSAFGCKATCSTLPQVVYISNQVPPVTSASYVPVSQVGPSQASHPPSSGVLPIDPNSVAAAPVDEKSAELPPAYTATAEEDMDLVQWQE